MIFRAAAITAVLIIVSLGPAAAASCDERIADHCPGAPIFAPTPGNAGQPVSAAPSEAAPLKIANGRRASRSAHRHRRHYRSARYRRGKSIRHAAARKHTRTALARKDKRRAARDDADDLVGLAVREPDHADRPLGNGTAGGSVPVGAIAAAGADGNFARRNRPGAAAAPAPMHTAALTPIGANTVPSRAFLPTTGNTPTTVVTTKTVNAAPPAPVRVASADDGQTPVGAVLPTQTQAQTAQTVSAGGTEITTLRAMFLAFGALLLAGTAIRLAIG